MVELMIYEDEVVISSAIVGYFKDTGLVCMTSVVM